MLRLVCDTSLAARSTGFSSTSITVPFKYNSVCERVLQDVQLQYQYMVSNVDVVAGHHKLMNIRKTLGYIACLLSAQLAIVLV